MTRWAARLSVALVLLLLTPRAQADDLRVMSFNIRYINSLDGDNAWPLRRELVFRTIENFDPDLLGLQEVTPPQMEEVTRRLDGYDYIGVPRDDGKALGERAPVMFKRDRFEEVRGGTFWLSETPDVPGSKGWDASLPRVCSWVELRDKRTGRRPVVFFNTHWDHKGVRARAESATLMRSRIADIASDKAVIITGDFNTAQESQPYEDLLGDRFVEALAEGPPNPTRRGFTFHRFTGKNNHDHRIDWVIRSDAFVTKCAEIDRTNDNGRYPSDHFPVVAVFAWRE